MSGNRLTIFDTTLRDGEQAPGFSLRIDEKLKMARQLRTLGVDIIEAGFPIASDADAEAVRMIATHIDGPVIAALARCHPKDIDKAGWSLAPAPRRRIHVFIATNACAPRWRPSSRRASTPTTCSSRRKTRPAPIRNSCGR
jgi:2-isopropylmalate synthase